MTIKFSLDTYFRTNLAAIVQSIYAQYSETEAISCLNQGVKVAHDPEN